jgi:hypothetical protein
LRLSFSVFEQVEPGNLFMSSLENLRHSARRWPVAIVALGLVLSVIWTATLIWFFMTATGYAAISLING